MAGVPKVEAGFKTIGNLCAAVKLPSTLGEVLALARGAT